MMRVVKAMNRERLGVSFEIAYHGSGTSIGGCLTRHRFACHVVGHTFFVTIALFLPFFIDCF